MVVQELDLEQFVVDQTRSAKFLRSPPIVVEALEGFLPLEWKIYHPSLRKSSICIYKTTNFRLKVLE